VVDKILNGESLSIPHKKRIAKSDTSKKRSVYSLPEDEAMVLKLLTWMMIRKYDSFFSDNLYSFRPSYSAKDALRKLMSDPDISRCFSYKLDIHNYFNSIKVEKLLPALKNLFADDKPLYEFFSSILSDLRAVDNGEIIQERKGVMAGMPYAGFSANIFLSPLDHEFEMIPEIEYCRYSDDIIIFAKDKEALDAAKTKLHKRLAEFYLEVNPDKVVETAPYEPWTFLGFECKGKEIDVSKISVQKLKAKMRRKARALARWRKTNKKDGWMAARAFIKHFNKMLYTSENSSEINWSLWYFPLITTDRSLKEIDSYMQDCVRYVSTGKRNKSRFDLRYDQMKDLGMQSLVNVWYSYRRA
jgi:retron-type reverse transcriptase